MKLTKRGRTILIAVLVLGLAAVVVVKIIRKKVRAVSIEEIELQEGVAVAVENPVRMDFTDYLYCDGEVDVSARYVLRSSIDEVVEAVHVDVGDIVKKGQILVEFRKGDIQADISAKKAAHDEAKRNYERYNTLLEKGGVSKNMVEARRTAMESAAAALRRAESKMEFARVRAPVGDTPDDRSGSVRVEARFVDSGEHKGKGKELITLVDLSTIEVRAMVPESGVRFANVGSEIGFRLEDEKSWRAGAVTRVGPSTDHPNRFFDVFVRLDNKRSGSGWIMRPGMYAQVRIARAVDRNALAVRSGAIKRRGAKRFVFIADSSMEEVKVDGDPGWIKRILVKAWRLVGRIFGRGGSGEAKTADVLRTRRVEIETGLHSEGYVQLRGDSVSENDTIVSSPRGDLRDGTKVRIVEKNDNGNS